MSAPNPEPKPQCTPTGCDNTNYCTWNGRGWECVGRKKREAKPEPQHPGCSIKCDSRGCVQIGACPGRKKREAEPEESPEPQFPNPGCPIKCDSRGCKKIG